MRNLFEDLLFYFQKSLTLKIVTFFFLLILVVELFIRV